METITSIQDKQIRAELAAIRKHQPGTTRRAVIFAARTRAKNSLLAMGLDPVLVRQTLTDAADMVALEMGSAGIDPWAIMSSPASRP